MNGFSTDFLLKAAGTKFRVIGRYKAPFIAFNINHNFDNGQIASGK
jgi:hypothetical protein